MVDSIGQARASALAALKLREIARGVGTGPVDPEGGATETGGAKSPAARMAAEGAPVDAVRVQAIKTAIAKGDYPVDPAKIAEKMLDLDLPGKEG